MADDPRDTRDPLHRALTGLPTPRAPRTLLPRVMAAAAEIERRRYAGTRPWRAWPLELQIAAAAAVLIAIAGSTWWWPVLASAADGALASAIASARARVAVAAPGAMSLAQLLYTLWDTFVQPVIGFVLVWIVMMAAACAAFAAALEHVTLGEA